MCYQITPTVVIRFRLGLERMPHANGGTPVFIQVAAARAFDVGPEVRGGRQVEVDAEAVFDPGVLAVRLKDRRSWSRIRSRA